MGKISSYIRGDKVLWGLVVLMCILSFMPIYSAASNLEHVVNNGTTIQHLVKHSVMVIIGLLILSSIPRIPYKWFGSLSLIFLTISIILILITSLQGKTIAGANASRWLEIPIVGISFQTSVLASISLLIYVAKYLYSNRENKIDFKDSLKWLWLPVVLIVFPVFLANFSTAFLIMVSVYLVLIIGDYPLGHLMKMTGGIFLLVLLLVALMKVLPDGVLPNRLDTWESRVTSFFDSENSESYQVEKAKIAIATGGVTGLGPGKSVQKNFLPQSSSDFIFAIIIEEYGLVGGCLVIVFYLIMLQRFLIIARKAPDLFGSLLVVALGLPIIIQAFLNMAVATNLVPVTGQTLPFVSGGGTSMWMTCVAVGIILSVSASEKKVVVDEEVSDDLLSLEDQLKEGVHAG
jgi:cell division protein FtsW